MIKVGGYDESARENLFTDWVDGTIEHPEIDNSKLVELFHDDYTSLNYGNEERKQIREFGLMHYRDVVEFLETVTSEGNNPGDGVYSDNPAKAVGEAFKIYLLPRILNDATFPQIERMPQHYKWLQENHPEFDLSPVIDLAEQKYETEEQRLSGR